MDVHSSCGVAVDCLLKTTALRKGCDNLTVVIIAFDYLEKFLSNGPNNYSVREDSILEATLPPLVELNDQLGILNDLKGLMALQ